MQSDNVLYANVLDCSLQRAQSRISSYKYSFKEWIEDEIERSSTIPLRKKNRKKKCGPLLHSIT